MTFRHLAAATVTVLMLSTTANADGWNGMRANDTGGIIPWSPAIARIYRQIAADQCARFSKIATITSVHRRYGDYIGFRCSFSRRYDPRKAVLAGQGALRTLY